MFRNLFVHGRRLLPMAALLVLGVLSSEGCNCDEELVALDAGPAQCALDTSCESGESYRFGTCQRDFCEADADCCPGTRCRTDFGVCWPHLLDAQFACDTDADCTDPGHRCRSLTIGERAPINVCAYDRCEGDTDCGVGRTCFQSVCVANTPCGGGCAAGEVCDVVSGQCAVVTAGATGCDAQCGEGTMMVLDDPDGMRGETCCATQCRCVQKPPVVPYNYGHYASMVAIGDGVAVSAYDKAFGDLVLVRYDAAGNVTRFQAVDGVPVAAPTADPNGPRAGIVEPGPNVGTFTAIGADTSGRVRIAYYDVDEKQLKFALEEADGTFSTHVVEAPTAGGDVGRFTDLAVDTDGMIAIAYQSEGGASGMSALRIARSNTTTPRASSDWTLYTADERPLYDPCAGACTTGQHCVLDGAAVCRSEAVCDPACGSAQACVTPEANPVATCLALAAPPSEAGIPKARGLFPSLVFSGGRVSVAYHDAGDGTLRMAFMDAAGTTTVNVLDGAGQGPNPTHKVGGYPSLVSTAAGWFVAYVDESSHTLKAWEGTPGVPPSYTGTIDPGARAGGVSGRALVGAGAQALVDDAGRVWLVYQDQTTLDLKIAGRTGDTWSTERAAAAGAVGFYSTVTRVGGTLFMGHLAAELSGSAADVSVYRVLPRPLP